MSQDLDEQVAVGDQAVQLRLGERIGQLAGGLLARRRPGDHLGEHRVVVRGDLAARLEPGVHAQAGAVEQVELAGDTRDLEPRQDTALRLPVVGRVLGVQAHLDRVPVGLADHPQVEGTALGHGELRLDQVDAVHQLGDRVLDLEAGVHLQEEEALGLRVVQELDRPRAAVVDGGRRGSRRFVQRRAGLRRRGWARVPPRRPSGGVAGSSSRARRGRGRRRGDRAPVPRRDGRARRTAR